MDTKIEFLFPSKSRPKKFFETLDNIEGMTMTDNWEVTCVLEESDVTMKTAEVEERLWNYGNVKCFYTHTTGKVDAINKGLEVVSKDYEILVLIADDIRFTVPGFEEIIRVDMQMYFPKLTGCLHYPDGQVGDRQITMPVMGRELVERFGYIYHPSYCSLWCDNEMLSTLKIIKKVKYINTELFIHYHPAWGKGENDDLYKHNESFNQIDKDNYFKRLSENFDL